MKTKVDKISEYLLFDGLEQGDCSSCNKDMCKECFEGCYWALSDKRAKEIARHIMKMLNIKED